MKLQRLSVRLAVVSVLAASFATLSACEQGSSSGSTAPAASQPQSMLGKTMKSAQDAANGIRTRDAQAGALADEISGSGSVTIGEFVFDIPEGWERAAPGNSMRAAELHARDTVTTFMVAGGTVNENIDRWASQMTDADGEPTEPAVDEETVAGQEVTIAEYAGTYMEGGMLGAPTAHPDYAMYAAIIPMGRSSVFIKTTGPASQMEDIHDQWLDMVTGMHR